MTRQQPFALLVPGHHPPRQTEAERLILDIVSLSDEQLREFTRPEGGLLVVDFETQGTEVWRPERLVVGVALADASGSCYLHVGTSELAQERLTWLLLLLWRQRTPLAAHNVQFDAAWASRYITERADDETCPYPDGVRWHNWQVCTLAAYKHLASEGFLGQRHGLKDAMKDILGWQDSNEGELDNWLCDNGWGKWTNKKDGARKARPNKAEMWRAPKGVLGKYGALDAESTFLLWDKALRPHWERFDAYRVYHTEWLSGEQGLQRHLVWQKLNGMHIDRPRLEATHAALLARLDELENEFRAHPQVVEHVAAMEQAVVNEIRVAEPARWKKLPKLGAEPERLTKAGTKSKAWQAWDEKRDFLSALDKGIRQAEEEGPGRCSHTPREAAERGLEVVSEYESHHWRTWLRKLREAESTRHFNLRSTEQLRELFYDRLGFEVLVWTDNEENPQPGTNREARKGWGEAGSVLLTYGAVEKMRSSCASLIEKLEQSATKTVYHSELRTPGTHTGRLSGAGGYNVQNVPKCKEILDCFVARPGHKILFADVAALEPAVLAQRSHDNTYMNIYGPDALPNDIYLAVSAGLGGELGDRIRATGYDPDAPTKEAIAKAKKEVKKERNIAKLLHLSCIAEGTLVRVRSHGWLPIEQVKAEHVVWDGSAWAPQSGAVLRGPKTCANFGGTAMTPDHEVLTNVGWQISERADPAQCLKPAEPSASWADVWAMAGHVARGLARRWVSLG